MKESETIFFTSYAPLPLNGGGIRSFNVLNALSRLGPVDVVILNSIQPAEKEELLKTCRIVYSAVGRNPGKPDFFRKITIAAKLMLPFLMNDFELNGRIHSLLSTKTKNNHVWRVWLFRWLHSWFRLRNPYPCEVYMHLNAIRYLQKDINKLLQNPHTLIVFDFNYMQPALAEMFHFGDCKLIANSHNVEFDLFMQSICSEPDVAWRQWFAFQSRIMQAAEAKSLALADVSFCCSEEDKKKYRLLNKSALIEVIPNGVDIDYFRPFDQPVNRQMLLFTGTMSYGPNAEAVKWFVNDIFPMVLEQHPNAEFVIAGRNARTLDIPHIENVKIITDPYDIRPYFVEACIYVVPLKQGGGTRLKILEAAAMKKPVISTSKGAEGLLGLNQNNILLANDKDAFCDAVCSLLVDEMKRKTLSGNLYNWVIENYTWEGVAQKIRSVV